MTEITRLSRFENAMMIKLTKRAARDTEIMKTLTILALVYLPASFVSVSGLPSTAEFIYILMISSSVYDGNGLHHRSLSRKKYICAFRRRILGFSSTHSDVAISYSGMLQLVDQAHTISQYKR